MATIFDSNSTQVVVIAILDNLYVDNLLKVLNQNYPNTHFSIFGMPSWTITNLQKWSNLYPKMAFNVSAPFNFDQSTQICQYIDEKYTSTYGGKPHELVYRGFETMMWYGSLLRKYGTIFNNNYEDIRAAPFTKFEIVPQWDNTGKLLYYENKHVYWLKYEDGILIIDN